MHDCGEIQSIFNRLPHRYSNIQGSEITRKIEPQKCFYNSGFEYCFEWDVCLLADQLACF